MRYGSDYYYGNSQLCWKCKNYAIPCSWIGKHIPIKGWDAELVFLDDDYTYKISGCPQYEFEDETCDNCIHSMNAKREDYHRCRNCAYHPSHKGIGDSLKDT